jgi:hypothetical protein
MVINKRVARKMEKRKCDRQLEAEVSIFSSSLFIFISITSGLAPIRS